MDTGRTEALLLGIARWLVAAAVILAVWLFGAAEPWAYLLITGVAGVGIAFWLLALLCARRPDVRAAGVGFVLLLLGLFVAFQALPLPPAVAAAISPFSAHIQQDAARVLRETHAVPGNEMPDGTAAVPATISVAPGATWRSLLLFIAYAGTFLVMANSIRRWGHVRHIAAALVVSGYLLAILAIVHKLSGSDRIFWFYTPRYGGNIFGPFSNRNHFGAHMNMLFGVALGLFLSTSRLGEALGWPNWRDRLAWLSTRRASQVALSGLAVMLMGGAVCFSLSRGAIASLLASLGVLAVVVMRRRGASGNIVPAATAAVLLVVAGVVWLGVDPVLQRLATLRDVLHDPLNDFRVVVTRDTLQLFGASPLWGCGFGAFEHAFPVFQTPSLEWRWLHAHNDWVQLLAEGGIIGAGLFLTAMLLWLRQVGRHFASASPRADLFDLGLMVGLISIALHSMADYSLHKPANALLLATLAGVAVAVVRLASERRAADNDADSVYGEASRGGGEPGGAGGKIRVLTVRALALGLLVVLVLLSVSVGTELRGELAFKRFMLLKDVSERARGTPAYRATLGGACVEADEMLAFDRDDPDALREASAVLLMLVRDREADPGVREQLAPRALATAVLATRAAPSDYLTWSWLARLAAMSGAWDEADLYLEQARRLVSTHQSLGMFGSRQNR